MHAGLRDLLTQCGTKATGDRFTHVTPHARWYIDPSMSAHFWTGYCQLVRDTIQSEPNACLCLAERSKAIRPVVAQMVFSFDYSEEDDAEGGVASPITLDCLQYMVHTYQTILLDYFRVDPEMYTEMIAVVLQSPMWVEEDKDRGHKYYKQEVRLHFPYANVDTGLQSSVIRHHVIRMLRTKNVLSMLGAQPVFEWEKIIADVSMDDPMYLYGSSGEVGRPKAVLSHIWSRICADMIEEHTEPDENELETALVLANHAEVRKGILTRELLDSHPLEFWVPLFLSSDYYPTVLLPEQREEHFVAKKVGIETTHIFGSMSYQENNDLSDFELADRLLSLLARNRYCIEPSWLDIGKALHHADNGGDNGLSLWVSLSRKYGGTQPPAFMLRENSIEDTCRSLYLTFGKHGITVKTLAWYARLDNPDNYAHWHREWCMAALERSLSALHSDVAAALYRVYWLDFSFDESANKWFVFNNHRWTEMQQVIDLRLVISGDFVARYESIRITLARQIHGTQDNNIKTMGENSLKRISHIIEKLKNAKFKDPLVKEAREYFRCVDFMILLNSNPNLTGMINGVIEVSGSVAMFRAAKPEDYISMSTNNHYIEYSWNNPLVKELRQWLAQAFPDTTLEHYFLKFAASCLRARNSDKIFAVWSGDGDNSKSMIVKLFVCALSAYAIKFPVCMLNEIEKNSGAATPQFARAKCTRIAFLDEPEDHIPVNKGVVKRFTGNDKLPVRSLYSNGEDIEMTFKTVLMCNKVPVISSPDQAVKNRTRIFPFLSKWVDNPPETEEEQMAQRLFKKNGFFENRIPFLAPAFIWLMTRYYPFYIDEGLTVPQIVTDSTNRYWRENDLYALFASECIEVVRLPDGSIDETVGLGLNRLYDEFKDWFKSACPGQRAPDRSIVCNEFSSRWGRMNNNCWKGFRIMTEERDSLTDLLSDKKKIKKSSTSSYSLTK